MNTDVVEIVLPGEQCDLCMICNKDAGEWTDYVTGYLDEDKIKTKIFKVDDTDLFPVCTDSLSLESVLSARAVAIFVSPGHLDLLVNNPESNYDNFVKDPSRRGVLFLLGVDENDIRSEKLEPRFGDFKRWNRYDNNQHHELVLKIIDIIDQESAQSDFLDDPGEDIYVDPTETPDSGDEMPCVSQNMPPQRPPKTSPKQPHWVESKPMEPPLAQDPSGLDKKKQKRKSPGYDKVELWQFQVMPYELNSDESTPVVLSFSQPLPVDIKQIEIILQGQGSEIDTIKIEVEKLNPHTLHFDAPNHPEGEVTMKIMMDGHCIGVESLLYKSSTSPLLGLHSFYLHLLNSILELSRDKLEPYQLDKAINSVFKDDSKIPVQTFESIFNCYEFIPSENSEYEVPTLLHLGAKYGLKDLSSSLMDLPASSFAHSVTNSRNKYPEDMARESDFLDMADTFSTAREEVDLQEVVGSLYDKVMAPYINVQGQSTATGGHPHPLAPSTGPPYSQVPSPLPNTSPHANTATTEDEENYMDMTGHQINKNTNSVSTPKDHQDEEHDYEPVDPKPAPALMKRKAAAPPSKFPFNKKVELCDCDSDGEYLEILRDSTGPESLGCRPMAVLPASPTSSETSEASQGYEHVLDAVEEFHSNHKPPDVSNIGETESLYHDPLTCQLSQGDPPQLAPRVPMYRKHSDGLDDLVDKHGLRSAVCNRSLPVTPRSQSPVEGWEGGRKLSSVCPLNLAPPIPKREPRRASASGVLEDEWYSEIPLNAPPASHKAKPSHSVGYINEGVQQVPSPGPPLSPRTPFNKSPYSPNCLPPSPHQSVYSLQRNGSRAGDVARKPPPDTVASISKSQQKLVDIMDMVKKGDINQGQAEVMFAAWKREFSEGNTGSFKEKKEFIKKLSEDYFGDFEPAYADENSTRTKQQKNKPGILNRIKMSFRPSQTKPRGPTAPRKAVGVAAKSTGSQPDPSVLAGDESHYLVLDPSDPRTSTLSNGSSGSRGSTVSHDSGQDSTGFESAEEHRKSKESLDAIPETEISKRRSMRINLLDNVRRTPPPVVPPRLTPRQPLPDPPPLDVEDDWEEIQSRRLPPPPPESPATESTDRVTLPDPQAAPPVQDAQMPSQSRRLPPPLPTETVEQVQGVGSQPETSPRQPVYKRPAARQSPIPSPRRLSSGSISSADKPEASTPATEPPQTQPETEAFKVQKAFALEILNVKLKKATAQSSQPSVAPKPSAASPSEIRLRPPVAGKTKPIGKPSENTDGASTQSGAACQDSPFGPRVRKKVPPATHPKPKT